MIVRDKYNAPINVGSLVAVSSNSGIVMGRVVKFNTVDYSPNDDGSDMRLTSIRVKLATGRVQGYDRPEYRIINLDEAHDRAREMDV